MPSCSICLRSSWLPCLGVCNCLSWRKASYIATVCGCVLAISVPMLVRPPHSATPHTHSCVVFLSSQTLPSLASFLGYFIVQPKPLVVQQSCCEIHWPARERQWSTSSNSLAGDARLLLSQWSTDTSEYRNACSRTYQKCSAKVRRYVFVYLSQWLTRHAISIAVLLGFLAMWVEPGLCEGFLASADDLGKV